MSAAELPDFVVIGAAKAGTTSLRRYLDQHPEVFMADHGEPSFFAHEGESLRYSGPGDDEWRFVTDLDEYRALFVDAPAGAVRGEISPRYLYFPQASERLHRYRPDAKIVAILRHPVDRAYSHFLMNRARGCEPEADFAAAIGLESARQARGWGWDWRYVGLGRYQEQLQRYLTRFPRAQLRVYLYDDWRAGTLFGDLFTFLGVDPSFSPDTSARERVAALPRSRTVDRLLTGGSAVTTLARRALPEQVAQRLKAQVADRNAVAPPPLDPAERSRLYARYFADEADRLALLIGRELPW